MLLKYLSEFILSVDEFSYINSVRIITNDAIILDEGVNSHTSNYDWVQKQFTLLISCSDNELGGI